MNSSIKSEPQHNTKGTPCNIVRNCKSGKPAMYIVGSGSKLKYACADHKREAFTLQAGRREMPEPEAAKGFEPEIEDVSEVAVGISFKAGKTVDGDD